jgi:hypothetical protein
MHALGQHLDLELAGGEPAQRRRHPQALVIAASRIEPDHEVHVPEARRERIEIRWKIVAAALLAGFDDADAPRVRDPLRSQRPERGERREHRVTVVGTPTAVQLPVLDQRRPRPAVCTPADHLGLLVEVSVQQHGSSAGPGNLEQQDWRTSRQANEFHREARDRLRPNPFLGETDHALDVAMRLPVAVEMRRLGRNADVFDEARDDLAIPLLGDAVGAGDNRHGRLPSE